MKARKNPVHAYRKAVQGVTLIELMISLVLGLLVVGAAIGIFISNRQTFRATENLGRIQETARTAFELMARDIREAGGNACDFNLPVANVVNGATGTWSTNWALPIQGYDNGALGMGTLAGTDAIQVLSAGSGASTVTLHNAGTQTFTINSNPSGFVTGDTLMVCDPSQVSIFKATVSGVSVRHAISAGNCSNSLGLLPSVCSGTAYAHPANSVMTRLQATRWYVKANGRGGNSLYQSMSGTEGEVAEGVRDMQITYLQTDPAGGVETYVDASAVTNWSRVRAARVVLTLEGQDRVGTNGNPIRRQLIHVVSLRNRNA